MISFNPITGDGVRLIYITPCTRASGRKKLQLGIVAKFERLARIELASLISRKRRQSGDQKRGVVMH